MILGENNEKMSKSKGNVVNPDDIVASHGADTLRLYEMFMGPLDASIAWSENGLDGARRFLDRVWRLFVQDNGELSEKITDAPNKELEKLTANSEESNRRLCRASLQHSDFSNDGIHQRCIQS